MGEARFPGHKPDFLEAEVGQGRVLERDRQPRLGYWLLFLKTIRTKMIEGDRQAPSLA